MKQELQAVNYRDGMVLAFDDGEVIEMMHMGFNRIGREWRSNTLEPVGSHPLGFFVPTHILNDKYKCIVFDNYKEYEYCTHPFNEGCRPEDETFVTLQESMCEEDEYSDIFDY